MNLTDLMEHERRAMAALAEHLVRADGQITEEEIDAVSAIASGMGQDDWRAAFQAVQMQARNFDAVLALAKEVQRRDAQVLIHATLARLAASDELVPSEARVLQAVQQIWGL